MFIRREISKLVEKVSDLEVHDTFDIVLRNGKGYTVMVAKKDSSGVTCVFKHSIGRLPMVSEYKHSAIRDYLKTLECLMPENLQKNMLPVYGKEDLMRLPVQEDMEYSYKFLTDIDYPFWTMKKCSRLGTIGHVVTDSKGQHFGKLSSKYDIRPMFKLRADAAYTPKRQDLYLFRTAIRR